MVNLEEAKKYMHIDHNDDDVFIGGCIIAADEYLKGAIGENYDTTSERARMLALMVVSDLYDNRGTNERTSLKTRTIVEDFARQMRLELKGGKNGIST